MPRRTNKFGFTEGARTRFSCRLSCVQCAATIDGNRRCQARICRYVPYCKRHCQSVLGVCVRPSSVRLGDGLYACQSDGFRPGDPIAPLTGDRKNIPQILREYGPYGTALSPYVVQHDDGTFTDGACRRGVGFYSATVLRKDRSTGFHISDTNRCNAEVKTMYLSSTGKQTRLPYSWIVAKRYIVPGDEIITDYGPHYNVKLSPSNPFLHTTY